MRHTFGSAAMAQMVERILGKDEVISSTLISSSRKASGIPGAFSVLFARFFGVSRSGGENGRPHPFSQILRKDAVLFCSRKS